MLLAERVRFELTVRLNVRQISSLVRAYGYNHNPLILNDLYFAHDAHSVLFATVLADFYPQKSAKFAVTIHDAR